MHLRLARVARVKLYMHGSCMSIHSYFDIHLKQLRVLIMILIVVIWAICILSRALHIYFVLATESMVTIQLHLRPVFECLAWVVSAHDMRWCNQHIDL